LSIQRRTKIAKNRDFHLYAAFAPTKQMERNEWFVEKAVEIGIDRITPLLSNYSERKRIKKRPTGKDRYFGNEAIVAGLFTHHR